MRIIQVVGDKFMIRDISMAPMLTVGEVSKILHVHSNTLRRWSDQGLIKSYRISSRGDRRFKQEDVRSFLVELNQNGSLNIKANEEI